jgi:uncharacterized protein (DUF486 family)
MNAINYFSIIRTVFLLILSNIFMSIAWYGHLKNLESKSLWVAIAVSWGIAFFEYCFQVPANRIGYQHYTLPQLKIIQEVITMTVFAVFAVWYMGAPVTKNFLWASLCLIGAAYFIFRDGLPSG